jgi:hypothetical protein
MEKKLKSGPMQTILTRLADECPLIKIIPFEEIVILNENINDWPIC